MPVRRAVALPCRMVTFAPWCEMEARVGERKVLMLGLDALDAKLLTRFCDEGALPNLAAFRKTALSFDMTSADGNLLHGSVWPTFASGTSPGTHGVYFWTQWFAEEQRHVRNSHPAFAFQ